MYSLQSVSITHTGKVRSANEDAVLEGDGIFAVADGMGGHNAGEVASSMAVTLIEDYMSTGSEDSQPGDLLQNTIKAVNKRIHEKASTDPELNDMGTTLALLCFSNAGVSIVNIGDSRAYLFRDGRLHRLTHDDSLVARLVDEGVINEDEARRHPQRNVILKALGVEPDIDFPLIEKEVRPGDLFLLSTDGLTSLVEDSEIEAVLAAAADIRKKAKQLLKRALDNGGTDNISIVIVLAEKRQALDDESPAGVRTRKKTKSPGRFFREKRNQ